MNVIAVRRRWWILSMLGLVALSGLLTVALMTWAAIGRTRAAQNESWWMTVIAVLVVLGIILLLSWNPAASVFTRFTEIGIERPTIRGWKLMPWEEIEHVEFNSQEIRLRSRHGDMRIYHRMFASSEQLLVEITRQVKTARSAG